MDLRFNIKNEKGLTLIEVLLSITILGIVLTTFLAYFNNAYSYTKMNEDKTVGINVARYVLNYFEQQDYTKIKNTFFPEETSPDPAVVTVADCGNTVPLNTEPVFNIVELCTKMFTTEINGVDYVAEVELWRDINAGDASGTKPDFLENQLIGVNVKINWEGKSTEVGGFIKK